MLYTWKSSKVQTSPAHPGAHHTQFCSLRRPNPIQMAPKWVPWGGPFPRFAVKNRFRAPRAKRAVFLFFFLKKREKKIKKTSLHSPDNKNKKRPSNIANLPRGRSPPKKNKEKMKRNNKFFSFFLKETKLENLLNPTKIIVGNNKSRDTWNSLKLARL